MKIRTAITLIESIVQEHVREKYSFNANLFGMGVVKSERTEGDYRKRQQIEDAWQTILRQVLVGTSEYPIKGKVDDEQTNG